MKQKLIDQLIHKAGARFGGDGINYDGFVPSKFAQLIVRECMDVCYRTDTEYEGHKVKPTVIASKVAEHFGVEE